MVQYKIIAVSTLDSEKGENELNAFLRTNKIVDVEKHLISTTHTPYWSFCVSYITQTSSLAQTNAIKKEKVDYKNVLDETSFLRFTKYREIRRNLAQSEAVPAYAIFTDEELAELAKTAVLTKSAMLKINGIGEKKVEKYAQYFIARSAENEA